MKHSVSISLATALCVVVIATVALAAQLMSVQVRSGQLRDKPAFLSKVVGTVDYGDQVGIVSDKNDWRKVTTAPGGKMGWMHASALTEQKIVLNPTDKDVAAAANSDEIALAGKGFNKQVEEKYQEETKLDYSMVDTMEKLNVPPQEVQQFMVSGELGAGGAQ